jgi:hypothetical protein
MTFRDEHVNQRHAQSLERCDRPDEEAHAEDDAEHEGDVLDRCLPA